MYRAQDRIKGRKIAVVYDAPSYPLESGGSWWERSQVIADFVRDHGGRTALVTREDDAETWRVGEGPGVSFAAAIEAWAETGPEALQGEEATVVVPLDERIYVGEVADGLVDGELVAVPEKALEAVREALASRRPVVAFRGGAQTEALGELVEPEALPFDPFAHRYRPVMAATVRHGLFHRIYLAVPVLLALGVAGSVLDLDLAGQEVAQAVAAADPLERMHPRAARAQLEELAASLAPAFAAPLYESGWERMDVTGPVLTARGSAAAFPESALTLANERAARFNLAPEGWEVTMVLAEPGAPEPVDGFEHGDLVRRVYAAGASVGGAVSLVATLEALTTRQSQVDVRIERPGPAHLAALGRALDGLPVTVATATCELGEWIAGACSIGLIVKGAGA